MIQRFLHNQTPPCACLPDWLGYTAAPCSVVIGQTAPPCLRAAYATTKKRRIPTRADASSNKSWLEGAAAAPRSSPEGLKCGSQAARLLCSCISAPLWLSSLSPLESQRGLQTREDSKRIIILRARQKLLTLSGLEPLTFQ